MVVIKFRISGKLTQGRGAMKINCSGAKLSFCALSTSLAFALSFLCCFQMFFLILFLVKALSFPWWRRTMSSDLISRAGSRCSTLLSPSCFFASALYQIICLLQNQYPSAQQLFENSKGSSSLAVHHRFKLVFIHGQVVCSCCTGRFIF